MSGRKAPRRPAFLPNPTPQQREQLKALFVERRADIAELDPQGWIKRRLKAQADALEALAVWREAIEKEHEYGRRTKAHGDALVAIIGAAGGSGSQTDAETREQLEVFDVGVGMIKESLRAHSKQDHRLGQQDQLISEAALFVDNPDLAEVVSGPDDLLDDRQTVVEKQLTKLRSKNRAFPVDD